MRLAGVGRLFELISDCVGCVVRQTEFYSQRVDLGFFPLTDITVFQCQKKLAPQVLTPLTSVRDWAIAVSARHEECEVRVE